MTPSSPRDRIIGMGFLVLSGLFFGIGAVIFFSQLRNQSSISHYLPARDTIAWLEIGEWRPEFREVLTQLFPEPAQAVGQRLADYHNRALGTILLANDGQPMMVYYWRVSQSGQLGRYLGLNENGEGVLKQGEQDYFLLLKRPFLFLADNKAALARLGPQTDSLSNDLSYQRLRNNLPRQSWGQAYYRVDGLWQQILTMLGHRPGDLVFQAAMPLLAKMGAVGIRLQPKGQSLELTGIQSLPLEKVSASNKSGRPLVGYLANFVPAAQPLLFINGQNLLAYYQQTKDSLTLNEPLSAKLVSLWARGISQRTGLNWQEDVLDRFRQEYGLVVNLDNLSWEIIIPLVQTEEAEKLQTKLFSALKNIIPTLHAVAQEVTLPDNTAARWLVADPAYELLDYQSRHNNTLIRGLRYVGQERPSFVSAWQDGALLIANDRPLLAASLAARQERSSLAQLETFQRLSQERGSQIAPYVFGNLHGLQLTADQAHPLTRLLAQFDHLLARQEPMGVDIIMKAYLSTTP